MKQDTPITCPKCSSIRTLPLFYDLANQEALDAADRGELILGGCCIDNDYHDHECRDCEHGWIQDEQTAAILLGGSHEPLRWKLYELPLILIFAPLLFSLWAGLRLDKAVNGIIAKIRGSPTR